MTDLKSMSNKKKAEYIWDYYKLHIIVAIVIICIVGSMIHSRMTKVDYVFNLTTIGTVVDQNKKNDLEKQLTSFVVKEGETRKEAIVYVTPSVGSNGQGDIMPNEYMQRFVAMISVGQLDLVLLDKDILENLAKQDILLKLNDAPGLNLDSIKNEKVEVSGSDNKRAVYAINVEDIKIFKDLGIDTNNKVIGIISSCKQKDKSVLVLKWLLNK
ncbi:hypothetical protein [Clostridium sp.]|uniref:hypothetical protein n=1 Tax=Clostridium sp. TaxID=1506 RepID=UPI003D6CDD48